jgi:hypothetical protein
VKGRRERAGDSIALKKKKDKHQNKKTKMPDMIRRQGTKKERGIGDGYGMISR